MRCLLISLMFLLAISSNYSQCDIDLDLTTQSEVDAFRANYGECDFFRKIILNSPSNSQDPITGLDSLIGLKGLFELRLQNLDSLNTLDGLDSIRFVNRFINDMRHVPDYKGLAQLDSVFSLTHNFADSNQDLSMYNNLRYINETVNILGDGKLEGLGSFQSLNGMTIIIRNNNITQDITNIFPENKLDSIHSFFINNCSNLSIEIPLDIQIISNTYFDRITNIEFGEKILEVSKYNLGLSNFDIFNNDFRDGFKNEVLGILEIDGLVINDFKSLFPNLSHIARALSISKTFNDILFSFLDEFQIPSDPPRDIDFNRFDDVRILLEDNLDLDICNSPYICKALLAYPDSVFISDNGPFCDKDYLQATGCLVSTTNPINVDYDFYPNPVSKDLFIESDTNIDQVTIYNIQGEMVWSNFYQDRIDVSFLSEGMYIIQLAIDGGSRITDKLVIAR